MQRRAILVTYPDDYIRSEAKELARAAGYELVYMLTQKYLQHSKYGVGSGKAEELKRLARELEVNVILFDDRLRSVQVYNLAKLTRVEVIDREKLILEIFSKRASTTESRLQVQLAELTYEMPRAKEKVRLAKTGEQPGFFGLGEYQAEVYYMAIKKRIDTIKTKLRDVKKRRELYRYSRRRSNIPTVSLAGYTGVGKTTIFNLFTGEKHPVDVGAFTTLTTSTRAIDLPSGKALLSDTVGFISRLPTYMIESFKSTLEELTYSNVVLLLVDSGEPSKDLVRKYNSCIDIMSELGVPPSRILLVFNKAELCTENELPLKIKAFSIALQELVAISAKTGYGVKELIKVLDARVFEVTEPTVELTGNSIAETYHKLDWARDKPFVKLSTHQDSSTTTLVKGPLWTPEKIRAEVMGLF
jgi:GTP-binding protein HflX